LYAQVGGARHPIGGLVDLEPTPELAISRNKFQSASSNLPPVFIIIHARSDPTAFDSCESLETAGSGLNLLAY
jgi:hypothetical protein